MKILIFLIIFQGICNIIEEIHQVRRVEEGEEVVIIAQEMILNQMVVVEDVAFESLDVFVIVILIDTMNDLHLLAC